VPEKEASGDFDYLRETTDGVDIVDEENAYASETDLDYVLAEDQSREHDGFDAFDENTWDEHFTSVSTAPWYRSPQSRTLLVASAIALSAIVISVSLLVFRQPSASDESTPLQSTTAVTTPLATATRERPPPPSPPPPPPPTEPPAPPVVAEPSAATQAPAVVRPSVRPRQTKPEIGVTRSPVTRQPISVAPQPRGPRQ
jgi:hypothetical protein